MNGLGITCWLHNMICIADTMYEATVTAKNRYGTSEMSEAFQFYTLGPGRHSFIRPFLIYYFVHMYTYVYTYR